MTINYTDLAKKYADGFANLDPADLDGATREDVLKFRQDVTGTDLFFASSGVCPRTSDGPDDKKKKKKKRDNPRFTMSTQNPVGSFGDVLRVKGWDLVDFNRRGKPFLFVHNIDEQKHPLGNMANVLKGDPADFVRGQPTLAGDAIFTERGLNPFNDLTHDMVDSGAMPGGSVSWRTKESRSPTEEELSADKRLRKWSAIVTRASLQEFSSVPVGMDPDAVKRRSADGSTSLEEELLRAIESGRYDEDLIARWRHAFLGTQQNSTRTVVAVGETVEKAVRDALDLGKNKALEGAIRAAVRSKDHNKQGADDSIDTARVSDAGTKESASSPSLAETVRALDVLGLPVTEDELSAQITRIRDTPEDTGAEVVRELRKENEALRSMVNEQGLDIKTLQERLALLESVLLPESASDDGGETEFPKQILSVRGDNGSPEGDVDTRDVYQLIADLDEAGLADFVLSN